MSAIYDILCEILTRLKDIQSRAARTETRLMRLAEVMHIDVSKKGPSDARLRGEPK